LRKDRLIDTFAEQLPECERADEVHAAPRNPAVRELRYARAGHAVSRRLHQIPVLDIPAVLHPVEDQVEVRLLARLATKIDMVGVAARAEVLEYVRGVIAPVDRPVVTSREHEPSLVTMRKVRSQYPALPGLLLQRFEEVRKVKRR